VKTYGGVEVEWLTSCPSYFTQGERAHYSSYKRLVQSERGDEEINLYTVGNRTRFLGRRARSLVTVVYYLTCTDSSTVNNWLLLIWMMVIMTMTQNCTGNSYENYSRLGHAVH